MTGWGHLPAWVRDPLVVFLAAGGALFAAYRLRHPDAEGRESKRITVTRDALLTFVQYRANAFNFDVFDKSLDELTAAEREAVVEGYVREEALYRESLAMGLDQGDYVIRQRLIQRLEFLLEGGDEADEVDEAGHAELKDFYSKFSTDYWEPPVYTFTHVFFSAELRGDAEAHEAAKQMLAELNERRVIFSGAVGLGDRPLYFQNYIERTRDFVDNHFGPEMPATLDRVEPSSATWYGPIHSPYGWHLVMLTERQPARLPDLAEIDDRVREDWEMMRANEAREASIDRILDQYEVRLVGLEPESPSAETGP